MIFEKFPEAGYLDQTAHTIVGYLLVSVFIYFSISWWIAILLSMSIAFIREMLQHPFKIGPGSRTDLAFWCLGSVLGAI